jgi:hypothetical protein
MSEMNKKDKEIYDKLSKKKQQIFMSQYLNKQLFQNREEFERFLKEPEKDNHGLQRFRNRRQNLKKSLRENKENLKKFLRENEFNSATIIRESHERSDVMKKEESDWADGFNNRSLEDQNDLYEIIKQRIRNYEFEQQELDINREQERLAALILEDNPHIDILEQQEAHLAGANLRHLYLNREDFGKNISIAEEVDKDLFLRQENLVYANLIIDDMQIEGHHEEKEEKEEEGVEFNCKPFNNETSNAVTCVACNENAPQYVSIECGHFNYCNDCKKHSLSNNPPCPICRIPIKWLRIYQ